MYALTPHCHLSKVLRLSRTCRATATSPARTSTADRRRHLPITTTTPATANDYSSLRSTWAHRAWVATGFASVLTTLAKSVSAAVDSGSAFEPLLAAFLGYILADLGTGVYHWAIDNYGSPSTPIFGPQIEAFQGHHRWPWTITRREFANNLHALSRAVTFAVMPIEFFAAADDAAVHAFVGACAGCVMMSQQFHAWAHGTKSRLPPVVVALQDAGVLVSRAEHAAHHREPYNSNYCIVSGVWNGLLDEWKAFEAMEMVVFFRFGVRPRSWSDPELEWKEETGGVSSE
ncbi:fatty acid desaturase 4, chloroplastic-like [Phoenix dactylifera]|uniref:Fatty acid desaturase 4, chloroplastic-like n=1 Tax=Phoenix dactylifera TaxID=42345 RepID=A0A8B7CY88_PHODC|nr:fatty acid desaturase 4, chloroplastic-like [Phoenix dactylifera]